MALTSGPQHGYANLFRQTGTVNLMTADGLRLWDAAINYALITDQPATRPAMPAVIPLWFLQPPEAAAGAISLLLHRDDERI